MGEQAKNSGQGFGQHGLVVSKTEWPKADVSKVLTEDSDRMKKLLKDPDGFYTPKVRPSGHDIGTSFSKD